MPRTPGHGPRYAALATAAVALLAAPAAFAATKKPPVKLQTTLAAVISKDPKTTNAVRDGLVTGALLVDPVPVIADLTGDGKPDAVVSVESGGAAGTVAVYVLTADGSKSGKLRVALRSQQTYQAIPVAKADHTLLIRLPQYAAGDGLCCPAKVTEKTYAWNARTAMLLRTGTRTVAGPPTPDR